MSLWRPGSVARPVRAAYEAGPTGYGLARELACRGVDGAKPSPVRAKRRAPPYSS